MFTSFLIALGLNFDTFSIAVVGGAEQAKSTIKDALKVGISFGFGQALMAQIGAFLGLGFKRYITHTDHWIAFFLLVFIGGKMIYESRTLRQNHNEASLLDVLLLIPLVVATSIDSFVVGISLIFLKGSILTDVLIIGLVTFAVSFIGFYMGKKLRLLFKNNIKIIGGLILVCIGIKTLFQHLFF